MSRRSYQLAEQIKEVVATTLTHMTDPRLELITVTAVGISPDLSHAKVYWTAFNVDEARRKIIQEALTGAKGYLRREIAQNLTVRAVPNLVFYYDNTMDVLEETSVLLEKVKKEDQKR